MPLRITSGKRQYPQYSKMKRITLILFGFSLIGISCKTDTKESDALYAGEVIPVKVAGIRFGETSNEVVATGLLTTENEARLSFKIGGVIDRILVNEGEFIRKGQLLATLKTAEINSQLEQARLGFIKAKRDYDRATNLYNDSVATLEQLQNAKTALDIAEQAVDQVSFNNKFASIVAPADGFVTKKNSNAGEVVGPGAPVLAISESNSQSNWLLKVGVSDKDWAGIQPGQKAIVELDAFRGKKFEASVYRKSQAPDATSGSFQVDLKIRVNNEKPAVGMFGKATIASGVPAKSIIIPYDALVEADGKKAFVFVPSDSNKVKRVPVIIESFDNNSVVIQSGLDSVREVIVSNSAFLNENSTIAIIR